MNVSIFSKNSSYTTLIGLSLVVLGVSGALATITVSIGNGVRISTGTQSRYRDPYRCYWDCDLVGCQLTRNDDECAYDCEKVCRSRYDYVGRSDASKASDSIALELKPKSAPVEHGESNDSTNKENVLDHNVGQTVRLYMPKNVTVSKFGIWERCAGQEGSL